MPEVVTFGETMVLMDPVEQGPLRYVNLFVKRIGGAESNFAIALARLGHSAGWVSRVGDDEFGKYVVNFIRGEGVDVSRVRVDHGAFTAVYFKQRRSGEDNSVFYYRGGSAASRMTGEEVDEEYLRGARFLHITGITPALSPSCLQAVKKVMGTARRLGVSISFDPNIRLRLWTAAEARDVLRELVRGVDVLMPSQAEGEILFGSSDPAEIAKAALALGAGVVVVKRGAEGCFVADRKISRAIPGFPVKVMDTIGAGDAFDAGFIAGLLEGRSLIESAELGNAAGAFAVTTTGDVEGLPTREELEIFLGRRARLDR